MTEARLNELFERIERGERELRALRRQAQIARWLTLAILAGCALFFATRPAATQAQLDAAVRAGTRLRAPFTIVDSAGKPILQVGVNTVGRGLVLFDASGKMLCGIGRTSQARGIVVYDDQQRALAGIGEGSFAGAPATGRGLAILDADQKFVAGLGVGMNGGANGRGLTVNDGTGAPVAGLGVWPQRPDRGQLFLTDRQNNPVFVQPSVP